LFIQNQTDAALSVEVVARASNLALGTAGLRVTVPRQRSHRSALPGQHANGRYGAGANRSHFRKLCDAAAVELPVYTPATTEAFATYGVIDDGALAQPVLYPTGVFPQYGGLEINTSSTALQALTDSVLYLVDYPFEGSEQLASRALAVAALADVLTAFQADGLPAAG